MYLLGWIPYTSTDSSKILRLGCEVTYYGRVVTGGDTAASAPIEIKSIRVESSNHRELVWGQHDLQIRDAMADFMTDLQGHNVSSVPVAGEQPRIWRVYGRDEIHPHHWKSFRYINRLLRWNTITEWNVENIPATRHCLQMRDYWQGSTVSYKPTVASPCILFGYEGSGLPEQWRLNLQYGAQSAPHRNAESKMFKVVHNCYGGDTYGDPGELPLPADSVEYFVGHHGGGLSVIDYVFYEHFWKQKAMLFDTSRFWYANVWDFCSITAKKGTGPNGDTLAPMFASNGRSKSPEELRLLSWSALVLGAKGLIHYSGAPGYDSTFPTTIPNDEYAHEFGSGHTVQSLVGIGGTNDDARIDNAVLGQDRLVVGDRSGIDHWLGSVGGLSGVGTSLDGDNTRFPYVGRQTMRQNMREVHRNLHPFMDELSHLRLVAWRAKGYRSWFIGNTGDFIDRIDTAVAKQDVRIIAKRTQYASVSVPTIEDYDSTFYDITLLKRDTLDLDSVFYVGVLNRRTDNRFDTATLTHFKTYPELLTHLNLTPGDQYLQWGSRRITIPFRFYLDRNVIGFRVQELRDSTPECNVILRTPPLDTVVKTDKGLAIDFLPGEGKIFRVTPVPMAQLVNTGFLSHNNQRKLVCFPEIASDSVIVSAETVSDTTFYRTHNGNGVYYHMVYHRRPSIDSSGGTQFGNPLTVYYRRSNRLLLERETGDTDSVARRSPILHWEPEIVLSDTILGNFDAVPGLDMLISPSCGYPALVVRHDTVRNEPFVYVVFACEYPFDGAPAVNRIAFVEAQLPAQDTVNDTTFDPEGFTQRLYRQTNRSRELESVGVNLFTNPANLPLLWKWGTPTIAAADSVNWYAWPATGSGIHVNCKAPHETLFQNNMTVIPRHSNSAGWHAVHPSLTTYSRLHMNEADVALVWQEGEDTEWGNRIRYTRLRPDVANLVERFLTHAQGPFTTFDADLTLNVDSTILELTQHPRYQPNNGLYRHKYPVIYRHLSDWQITALNSRAGLGLVNHKAERIWWSSRENGGIEVLSRLAFDVSDFTVRSPGTPDDVYAHPPQLLFHTHGDLRWPDIAQGHNITEEIGVVNPTGPWYGDSADVVNFVYDDSLTGPTKLLQLTFGWNYYGLNVDHEVDTLPSTIKFRVYPIGLTEAKYPHLAARYTMAAHGSWQLNRRIYDLDEGTWTQGSIAPRIHFNADQFFKETTNDAEKTPQARSFYGWADGESSFTVSAAVKRNDPMPMRLHVVKNDVDRRSVRSRWFTLPLVSDFYCDVVCTGAEATASAFLERKSDGVQLDLNVFAGAETRTMNKHAWTLISDPNEQYRLVMVPEGADPSPIEDIGLHIDDDSELSKNSDIKKILDLRRMRAFESLDGELVVYPNPASEAVSIIVWLATADKPSDATLSIVNIAGEEVYRQYCLSTDVVVLQTSHLRSGTYAVHVSASGGRRSATLTVVR